MHPLWITALSASVAASAAAAQTSLFTIDGDSTGDQSGSSVASVGDVDGDGSNDFAIGSPRDDTGGNNAGMARVYSGRTLQPLHTWYGAAASHELGSAIAGVGDVDGDGTADVLVGAPGGNSARVFSGATGLAIHTLSSNGSFGHSVAGGGYVDGDAVPDLIVGAPQHSSGGISARGAAHVYSGASGALIRTHLGANCYGYFGWSVAFFGDTNADGRDEYAAGQPATPTGCASPVEVRAFDAASGALAWVNSAGVSDQLGWSMAPLADVTGDGIAELLVGAPQDPGIGCACNGKGFVRALNGATGAQVWQVSGTSWYAGLGFALTAIGDLDGNGYEDFAASQPATEGCGGNTQAVQIREGLTGALLHQIPPPAAGDQFGFALASGDANDDGLRDLLIGAPCSDPNGANSGATYVHTLVRVPTAYCTTKINSAGCTPSIYSTGSPSLAANTFRVKAQSVLNQKSGLLFWGRTPKAAAFQGGYLCVQAPTKRTSLQNSDGNPPPDDCSGQYSFHFSADFMNGEGIAAGDQIFCQYWSRDPSTTSTTGLTDGLAFYVEP